MLKTSPLDAAHRALGAKLVPFGGWEMPLSYGTGTLAEHRACRSSAVAFDVSHLGTVRVSGSGAQDRLQSTLVNDLGKVEPGRAQYTLLLDEADASITDDIIIWWRGPSLFDVMPNASNTDRVLNAIGGEDVTLSRAVIAVQGPEARTRLATISEGAAAVKRFRVVDGVDVAGVECVVAGTGYTGEDGVEIALPADAAPQVWDALMEAGVTPAGLGARDTLRLEAGLPLHGQELGPGVSPLQARLSWVVAWDKPAFIGREALLAERDRGVTRELRGLEVEGRRPPRTGQVVSNEDGPVGEITSGNFAPSLERGIALGFLAPGMEEGTELSVDMRGTAVPARVVSTPFYRP